MISWWPAWPWSDSSGWCWICWSGVWKTSPKSAGAAPSAREHARALAAAPAIIYMDEPFGALDVITRLKMRADLIRIWQAEQKTILFVTNDIEEAVQLSDRVLIILQRPATVRETVVIDLPRPRDLDSPGYLEKSDHIFHAMGMSLKVGEKTK